MAQERADEIVRKVIYARLTVMPRLNDSLEAFNVGRMIGQMQRQLVVELALEVKPDVVERSKVNKAIEEIRKLSPTPTVNDVIEGNPEKDEIWAVLVEVLEILKRNLGE